MSTDPSIRQEAYPYFLSEASTLLQQIEQDLLDLVEERTAAKVHSLMRSAHTLKGAAATVGLETIQTVAHVLEDVFRALYNPEIELDAEVEGLLFEGYECLRMPLMAEFSGGQVDDSDVLNRAASIIARLQEKLGDLFDREAPIPTSEELGFDVVQSMFEVGVAQRLNALEQGLAGSPAEIAALVRKTAEVFAGLAESLELPGFAAIAYTTLQALDRQPQASGSPQTSGNIALAIAQAALADFKAGQQAVLTGDRTQGGNPSEQLLALATGTAGVPEAGTIASEDNAQTLTETVWQETEAIANLGLPDLAILMPPAALEVAPVAAIETTIEEPALTETATEETVTAETVTAETVTAETVTAETAVTELGVLTESQLTPSLSLEALFGGIANVSPEGGQMEFTGVPQLSGTEPSVATVWTVDALEVPPETTVESTAAPREANVPSETVPSEIALSEMAPSEISTTPSTSSDRSPSEITSTPAPITPHPAAKPALKPAVAPSASNATRNRETGPSLRVGLEQVVQLDYLVGEILTNQIQSNDQDEQLRLGIRELLDQLSQHRHTLSDLQTCAQQMGLDVWGDGLPLMANRSQPQPLNQSIAPIISSTISLSEQFDVLEMDRYTDLQILTQKALNEAVQLEIVMGAIDQQLRQTYRTRESRQRLFTQLRDDIATIRLQPVGDLLNRFPRVLRQLSASHRKPVDLQIQGAHVLVDRSILEPLYDALLHLVRNAFDHGIEPAETRKNTGKPETGRIELVAYQHSNRTIIEVRDDGGGIDLERVARKAIDLGLLDAAQKEPFSEETLLEMLFQPGFSTASRLSDLSGRGVGLDVVRSQIEKLGGSITLKSVPGQGTTFSLRLPMSMTIAKLLVCRSGQKTYAIASDTIQQVLLPHPEQFQRLQDGRMALRQTLERQEALVPVYALAHLLSEPSSPASDRPHGVATERLPVLLVRSTSGWFGLQIDQALGEQELAIRSLHPVLSAPTYIQGCSVLGNNHLALVLDIQTLLNRIQTASNSSNHRFSTPTWATTRPTAAPTGRATTAIVAAPPQVSKLLLIDDSLTQRRTLERTLQGAGYLTSQAEDGLDALTKLRQEPKIDLIICDLEMPRMNGFEVLSETRKQSELAAIPIVILTSRSGAKYRQLALELGATAFLSKPYSDQELLKMIRELIK